ncbi:Hypothetical predicted protein [Mytilus galloprovincialis]|uniref:Farnesoic acid O-methyl transferase domain-containing protein n=1 Tax=Mytilus galloprovincialis TaxID=29158 RepID=A0A8B6FZP0_MYTGA|nr:Hypothetical predicted protein [Mytilus galloprovincialis]
MATSFLVVVTIGLVAGQLLVEIWIKTKDSGTVDALRSQNVYDYYTSLSSYHLFPAQNRSIKFSVKACHDAFILLSAAVDLNSPDFYEICLGCGYRSSQTFLRRKYNTGETLAPYIPEIINCAAHVTFTLSWTVVGRIILTKDTDNETKVIIDWTDPTPLPIQGVGVMMAWGAEGIWILKHNSVFTGHYCGEPGIYGDMTLLTIGMQPSRISCLLECLNNYACYGVNFNANTSKCELVAERQLLFKSVAHDWNFYLKC